MTFPGSSRENRFPFRYHMYHQNDASPSHHNTVCAYPISATVYNMAQILSKRQTVPRQHPKEASECRAWKELTRMFGHTISHKVLVSIYQLTACVLNLKTNRDAKRCKDVLIQWFDENWEQIHSVIAHIQLYNEDMKPIGIHTSNTASNSL